MKKWILLIGSAMLLSGCAETRPSKIDIELKNADGDSHGYATLTEKADGLQVTVALTGLEPGPHAIHFHEKGVCEGPNFESAGGHYNPDDKDHGLLNPDGAHAGDLPNIVAEPDGTVKAEFMANGVTLKEGRTTLFIKEGTSLIVHEKADDGMSQPAGDAGKRIACGVINLEEQKKNKDKPGKAEEMKEEEESK
ncbi:superoxide dismutase family protein [Bacillus pinisoli]|uniref:superoxide dismutase family protein n=1 Tax=Bacillus pinisoli TaxID=2901866 RepID=UPI001FF0EAD3|nr:superoxide dismutase family protein [Bacillus pinisoli]